METSLLTSVLWNGFIGAGLASLGFGVLFNVRGNKLIMAGLTGGIGGLVYQWCLGTGWIESLSNFMAAMALSVCGEILARKMKTTATTFTACALIPLVPGGTAYEMMVEFSSGHAMSGILKMMDMISISGMLAMGILTVSTLTRFFFYSKRQLKKTGEKIKDAPILHPKRPKNSRPDKENDLYHEGFGRQRRIRIQRPDRNSSEETEETNSGQDAQKQNDNENAGKPID